VGGGKKRKCIGSWQVEKVLWGGKGKKAADPLFLRKKIAFCCNPKRGGRSGPGKISPKEKARGKNFRLKREEALAGGNEIRVQPSFRGRRPSPTTSSGNPRERRKVITMGELKKREAGHGN